MNLGQKRKMIEVILTGEKAWGVNGNSNSRWRRRLVTGRDVGGGDDRKLSRRSAERFSRRGAQREGPEGSRTHEVIGRGGNPAKVSI
jgi:hypothetical protein